MKPAEGCEYNNVIFVHVSAVIGPLIIAGVSIDSDNERIFRKHGVKDSKILAHTKRIRLAKSIEEIAKDVIVIKVSACRIDNYRKTGVSLNKLEAIKFADIVNYLNPERAFIDSPDTDPEKLRLFLKKMVNNGSDLVVEHKADVNYPVCSAASIIAKVAREEEVKKLKGKYGDFGSGYTSDTKSIDWLKDWRGNNKHFPEIVRKSWITSELIDNEKKQLRLGTWLKGLIEKKEC